MSQTPYSYTLEKLTSAVDCMVIHPGDVRERLACAFFVFHTLNENDFPPKLRADWRWVIYELSKYGPLVDHKGDVRIGSVQNTMRRVRRATGVKIAERLYTLYRAINEHQSRLQYGTL